MQDLVERFKNQFQSMKGVNISQFSELYRADIIFKAPAQEIQGLVALEDYMAKLYQNLEQCNFEYLDQLVCDHTAYIKWIIHFRHPRMGDRCISVRGISHIQFDKQIYFQENQYDLGAMLYENLPVFGGLTRWIKRRQGMQA